jgi:hypothetical protein
VPISQEAVLPFDDVDGRVRHCRNPRVLPLSEGRIVDANMSSVLNLCRTVFHQKKSPQEVANVSFGVDGHKRIDHSPKNRTHVRHSSEQSSELCNVTVNSMSAFDGLVSPVDFPPRSKEHFRWDVVCFGHRLEFYDASLEEML